MRTSHGGLLRGCRARAPRSPQVRRPGPPLHRRPRAAQRRRNGNEGAGVRAPSTCRRLHSGLDTNLSTACATRHSGAPGASPPARLPRARRSSWARPPPGCARPWRPSSPLRRSLATSRRAGGWRSAWRWRRGQTWRRGWRASLRGRQRRWGPGGGRACAVHDSETPSLQEAMRRPHVAALNTCGRPIRNRRCRPCCASPSPSPSPASRCPSAWRCARSSPPAT